MPEFIDLTSDIRSSLIKESLRIAEDTTYLSKSHYNAAATWTGRHYILGLSAAVLSALAGVSALAAFEHHATVAGVIAFLVAAVSSVMTFLDPSKRASEHHSVANQFNCLKGKARRAAELDGRALPDKKLRGLIDDLALQKDSLNEIAPQVPRGAFLRARRGIEEGESQYEIDEGLVGNADSE